MIVIGCAVIVIGCDVGAVRGGRFGCGRKKPENVEKGGKVGILKSTAHAK